MDQADPLGLTDGVLRGEECPSKLCSNKLLLDRTSAKRTHSRQLLQLFSVRPALALLPQVDGRPAHAYQLPVGRSREASLRTVGCQPLSAESSRGFVIGCLFGTRAGGGLTMGLLELLLQVGYLAPQLRNGTSVVDARLLQRFDFGADFFASDA